MTVERFFVKDAKKAYAIDEFLREELKHAGYSRAEVKRTPLGTRIIIYALRPGLVIGAGGENIKRLTEYIEKKFQVENPHLEVEQVSEPYLDANIVAWRVARALERGGYFKRVANLMVERVMQAGARGVEIRLSGKLPSARAKTWKFVAGNLRKCGQEVVDHARVAYDIAMTKPGVIGVKVTIIPPDIRFSDEIREKVVIETKIEKEGKEETVETKEVEKRAEEEVEKELEEVEKGEVEEEKKEGAQQ